jgi:predicted DNA-binding transcriptional regulator AlpA
MKSLPPPAVAVLRPGETMRDLMTKREVAERLRWSVATLGRRVREGRFPAPVKDSATAPCLWPRWAVETWVTRRYG